MADTEETICLIWSLTNTERLPTVRSSRGQLHVVCAVQSSQPSVSVRDKRSTCQHWLVALQQGHSGLLWPPGAEEKLPSALKMNGPPTKIIRRQSWRKSLPIARWGAPTIVREKHSDVTAEKWRSRVSLVLSAARWLIVSVQWGSVLHPRNPTLPLLCRVQFPRKTVQTRRNKTKTSTLGRENGVAPGPGVTMGGCFCFVTGSAVDVWQPECWQLIIKACRLAFSHWINNTHSYSPLRM